MPGPLFVLSLRVKEKKGQTHTMILLVVHSQIIVIILRRVLTLQILPEGQIFPMHVNSLT